MIQLELSSKSSVYSSIIQDTQLVFQWYILIYYSIENAHLGVSLRVVQHKSVALCTVGQKNKKGTFDIDVLFSFYGVKQNAAAR